MDEHVRQMFFGLCNFFDIISRKLTSIRKLDRLQEEIMVILCELEMYFPPAFFDIMVHLLVISWRISSNSGRCSCTS
jgi:hypothetical protein